MWPLKPILETSLEKGTPYIQTSTVHQQDKQKTKSIVFTATWTDVFIQEDSLMIDQCFGQLIVSGLV